VNRKRRTAEQHQLQASLEAAADSAERLNSWINAGKDNGDGTFTILTWNFVSEDGDRIAADMIARLGAPHLEEVTTRENMKALIKSRVEHLGTFYAPPGYGAEEETA
jgi:phage gp16-like protein